MTMNDGMQYTVEILTEQDKEEVLRFLQRYFFTEEPLNRYLNDINNSEVNKYERGYRHLDMIKEGLSLIAFSPQRKIVGVLISTDVKADSLSNRSILEQHPNYFKIKKFMDEFERQYLPKIRINENEKELAVKLVIVHPKWKNKGVPMALCREIINMAKQKNYCQIRAIGTNALSINIAEKMGFKPVHTMKFEDYKENGKVIFKPDPPHTHITAMLLKLYESKL